MQLLQMGAFTAQGADSTTVALNAMIIENKEQIIKSLQELKMQQQQEQMQMMQMQQAMAMQGAPAQIPPSNGGVVPM
jgi:hypothetical protein